MKKKDGDAIELAFSKKKIEAGKNWLRQFEPGTYLDQKKKFIKYSDFVNKELILFSMADLQRSIPSVVDGLKPGQRKILFCSFKRNFVKEANVAQFSGYVSEHSAYHHGEQSLASTIIGMAQDFVGSNNINLLQPNGQFGTRHQGGKDHASARYIYTRLSPLTRFLFPKDDDILLDYFNEDGQSIEPTWYMPIIPMVLINGSEGIGTGWSSFVPNYNPRDIIANVRRLLNDERMQPMDPWYRGFKGLIEKSITKEAGVTYAITGIIEEEVDSATLRITELPIRRWTQDYKEFLESLMTGNDKIKEPFIKDYREHNDDTNVHVEVILTDENMNIAIQEGLEKKFKLTTTVGTTNMHLFDSKGVIKKYDTPEQILEEFFHLRLEFYTKRKKVLLDNLELDLLKVDNKVRFILGVVHGEIIVNNRKRAELFLELKQKGFTPFPKKSKGVNTAITGATVEEEEDEESPEVAKGGVKASDYEYLLSMAIGTLTLEKAQELCAEKGKLENEVEELRRASPKSLWMKDLEALEKELDYQDYKDAGAEKAGKEIKTRNTATGAGSRLGAKKPRKNANYTIKSEGAANYTEIAPETSKPKPRGQQKKPTKKKINVVESDDEDEEVLALKDRLAAYNLDSSPDHTAMGTEVMTNKEPSKRAVISKKAPSPTYTELYHDDDGDDHMEAEVMAKKDPSERAVASKKAPSSTYTELSDDDDDDGDQMATILDEDDEEFRVAESPKEKGRGRKPGGDKSKVTTTTARKSGTAQNKPVLGQKLITEVLKPADNGKNSSLEKKVRRTRASPFNKKSSSVLGANVLSSAAAGSGKEGYGGPSSSGRSMEAVEEIIVVPRNRSMRENRRRAVYIESDSDSAGEGEPTDDTDFVEDDD